MSDVVKFHKEGPIGIVVLEDREYKNTFSKQFVQGLLSTFETIGRASDVKVIVVHGYDNYFCCGGTKDELIGILEGTMRFSDLNFHDLLLRCEVPVISAMQGHALGGGLAFGCYADMIVLGAECLYSANFMKYGFTPGMGATYILPKKFGEALGTEMLFSAKTYYGHELQQRGLPFKVVRKTEVVATALEMAKELADKPLLSLKVLKEHLTRPIRSELPRVIETELEMHRITFAQPEVRSRIEELYAN